MTRRECVRAVGDALGILYRLKEYANTTDNQIGVGVLYRAELHLLREQHDLKYAQHWHVWGRFTPLQ